ncbi:MAG: ornithine--oxo-acid transaminase [Limnochordia bacterium]|nr:ornithine--oxo-acid transaminase [Limnochordia bacterium]
MISMAGNDEFIKDVERYSANNYHPLPIVIEKGEGVWVYDVDGKKYLDMLSAYSALNQGHRHPKIIGALLEQAAKVTLTSRAFHNETMGAFLKTLCQMTGFEKALPMNTGAEAVETALKAARKWGLVKKGVPENQGEIIVCENNFHGRTVTIVSFSTEDQYRYGFGPFTPGFVSVPFGDAEALEKAISENTVAILAEPIQGEGGVLVPPAGYLAKMRELATRHNILMMLDEIQTGLGRTGRLFAYEYEDAKPDVLLLGKALGGGVYPVSAMLSEDRVMDVFGPGDHGSTFGGNPLGCAVGLAALEVLEDENLVDQADSLGQYFRAGLENLQSPLIKEVRGKGLLIGVEIKEEHGKARPFCERLMEHGLLCKETHDYTIRFAPPLTITKEEIDWALLRIAEVLG